MTENGWHGFSPSLEASSPAEGAEPLAAYMEAYQTPGRGNRNCPKGVCREGSGYVASIRINKRQQKGPVRSSISEATRDRAQMMFMKATRTSGDVEQWIKSLKRKKRRASEKTPGMPNSGGSLEPSLLQDPNFGRHQLAQALEQLMLASTQPIVEESPDAREQLLQRIYEQQAALQTQQVQILQEMMLAQQSMLLSAQQHQGHRTDDGDETDSLKEDD